MSQPKSLLVTAANYSLDSADLDALAQRLGLELVRVEGTDIASAFAADLPREGALIAGTGDYNFDAELAAALGVPVALIADQQVAELASRRILELNATPAGVAAPGALDAFTPDTAGEEAQPAMSPVVFESWLLHQAKANRRHIVLPEGEDDRILQAAHKLLELSLIHI